MRVIVAGSRDVNSKIIVHQAIIESEFDITEVISGCARGVDKLGEAIALDDNIPVKQFPANWDEYGRGAGFIRNREMAEYADALIAVWDGKSKGTKHMIDIARKYGLEIYVYRVER
jgi:hypothetical protein